MAAILSAEHLSKSYTLKKLLTDVTIYIGEHDRIGVVGVNGTGKSTLLKLLAGMEEPDGGVVMRKNGLRVSYLPQMPDYSVARTAVQQVLYDAPKDVGAPDEYEAKSLLSQFGISDFDADVRTLSGGQKKRIALAAALIRPVDLLLLDEPTNHIDAETIALLESRLAKYRGTLMMVTHDRYFLDRTMKRIFAFEGDGKLRQYEGGYTDYSLKKSAEKEAEEAEQEKKAGNGVKTDAQVTKKGQRTRGPQKLKFTYQEQRDYETIESEIAALEEKIDMLDQEMAAASTDFVKLNQLVTEKEEAENLLEEKMDRWMYLEDLAARIAEQ